MFTLTQQTNSLGFILPESDSSRSRMSLFSHVARCIAILFLLVMGKGQMWADEVTYHTCSANQTGTSYETYGFDSKGTFGLTEGVVVSGTSNISKVSYTLPTEDTNFLDVNTYNRAAKVTNSFYYTFYVTNCTQVDVLCQAISGSRPFLLQVYNESGTLVGSASESTKNVSVISVSNLTASSKYIIKISDQEDYAGNFFQIRFTTSNSTVTYDKNGATDGSVPIDANDYTSGNSVTVLGNTGSLIRYNDSNTCYTFAGWNTKADGSGKSYAAGDTFVFSANTTLYAQWTKVHTIYTNGTIGSTTASDNTWWTAFSPFTTINKGETYTFTFKNHGGTDQNYYNYLLVGANKEGHSTDDVSGYAEYFVLRADNYGWGDMAYQTPGTCSYSSDWGTWKTNMASGNFTTTMNVQFTGTQFIMTSTTTDGSTTYTYNFTSKEFTEAESAVLFFTVDHSYLTDFSVGHTVYYDMKGHGSQINPLAGVTAIPTSLPTPTADGYTFGGWFTDNALTLAAVEGAELSEDVKLYAKWIINKGYIVNFNGNGKDVVIDHLQEPQRNMGVLLPTAYETASDVTIPDNTDNDTGKANWTYADDVKNYGIYKSYGFREAFFEKSVPAGDVLTQKVTALANGKYAVVLDVAASKVVNGTTGNNLTQAFAGSATKYIPVIERSDVGMSTEEYDRVVLITEVTDGTLTYGLRNTAASGDWYLCRVVSIKKITNDNFEGWYNAKTGGTRIGGVGDSYTPNYNGNILYAHWKIGATDCSTAYAGAFSDAISINSGKTRHITFHAKGNGEANANGFYILANGTASADVTSNYFRLRGDNWDDILETNCNRTMKVNGVLMGNDNDGSTGATNWSNFRTDMKAGADVDMYVSYNGSRFYITATWTVNGRTYLETEETGAISSTANPAYLFLTVQKCCLTDVVIYDETAACTISTARGNENGSVPTIANSNGMAVTSETAVQAGESLTITAKPNSRYSTSWTCSGTAGTASGNTYTVSSIAANTTITATYQEGDVTFTGSDVQSYDAATKTIIMKPFASTQAQKSVTVDLGIQGATNITLKSYTSALGATYVDSKLTVIALEPESTGSVVLTIDGTDYTLNFSTAASTAIAPKFYWQNGTDALTFSPANTFDVSTKANYTNQDQVGYITVETPNNEKVEIQYLTNVANSWINPDKVTVNDVSRTALYWRTPKPGYHTPLYVKVSSQDGTESKVYVFNIKTKLAEEDYNGIVNVDINVSTSGSLQTSLSYNRETSGITLQKAGDNGADVFTKLSDGAVTTNAVSSSIIDNGKLGLSGLVLANGKMTLDESTDYYVETKITLNSTHKDTPKEIWCSVQPVSYATNFRIVMEDDNGHRLSRDFYNIPAGAMSELCLPNDSSEYFVGTTKLRLYAYGYNSQSFRFGPKIEIIGKVEAVAATSNDATLKSLSYNGRTIDLVDGTYAYTAKAISNITPVVEATVNNDAATRVITQPTGEDGTATIVVTAGDKSTTKTYTVTFTPSDDTPAEAITWSFADDNNGSYNDVVDSKGNIYRLQYQINGAHDSYASGIMYNGGTSTSSGRYMKFTGIEGLGRLSIYEKAHCGSYYVAETQNGTSLAVGFNTADYTTGSSTAWTADDTKSYYIDYSGQVRVWSVTWTPVASGDLSKYNVSVSNDGNGSASVDHSGSVTEGTTVTFTATPNDGYAFYNWTDASGNVVSTVTPYIIQNLYQAVSLKANFVVSSTLVTGTATFPLSVMQVFGDAYGNTYTKYDTGIESTANITLYTNSRNVQQQGTSSTKGTKVRNTGTFTITPKAGCKIKSITIATDRDGRNLTSSVNASVTNDGSVWTYSYSDLEAGVGVTFTNNADNIYVSSIQVEYEYTSTGTPQLNGTFAENAVKVYEGDANGEAPVLTVTAAGQIVDADKYTVTYSSGNTSVVSVNSTTGELEYGVTGSAIVTAIITPTSNSYIAGSASFTVTVSSLNPLVITAADVNINSTDAEQTEPSVYVHAVLDGTDTQLTLGTDYSLVYSIVSGTNVTTTISGDDIIVGGASKSWTVGSSVIKVTVVPNTTTISNYHCTSNTTEFTYTVVDKNNLWTPTIDFPDVINLNISTSKSLTAYVTYNGNDITSGFDLKYEITDGSSYASVNSNKTLKTTSTVGTATLTITATPKTGDVDKGEINYSGQYYSNTKTVTVNVKSLNSFTLSPTSLPDKSIYAGKTYQMPDITVSGSGSVLENGTDYDITYTTNAKSVASVDATGLVTGVSAGTATIIVYVTDHNTESLKNQDATLTFVVTVKDPTARKVEDGDANVGGSIYTNEAGTLSVTLGGWIFPNNVSVNQYGATSETFGKVDWGKNSTARFNPPGYDREIIPGDNTNPRNEFGNNSQPQSTRIYNHSMEEQTVSCVDPMFNVPTSGAYLVFEPKTNGTVMVTVEQNGVFHNTGASYRPQRRVFVLDEAGTLIPSTPKLEVASGKFPADYSDFTKYTWDLQTVTMNTDLMKSHFGIDDFKSDNTNFVNGVYECLVDNDILKNNAVKQGATFKGAKGWCVMVMAPVTYTFDVKAGKTYYLYNFGSRIGFYGFKFNEAAYKVDEITYDDTKDNTISPTADGHVAQVSLNRKYNIGKWNAGVLPFSLNKQQVDAIFGTTYSSGNEDGTQILYFEEVDGTTVYYTRHAYNTIVAGKPFLIKPSGKLSNISTDVDVVTASEDKLSIIFDMSKVTNFPYVTIENTKPEKWGRSHDTADYWWQSDYKVQTIVPGDYYINADGDLIERQKSNAKIQAFRSYLKKKDGSSGAKLGVAMYNMLDDDSDIPSMIQEIQMDEEGNVYEVPTTGKVYNLNGQLVSEDASLLYSLPTGIYIVNGKKYFVK